MKLHVILGDQLNTAISSLKDFDRDSGIVLMCEVLEEATYVKHHKKKIAFLFSAMRHFAEELRTKGYRVHYSKLDDADNTGSFLGEVGRAVQAYNPHSVVITEPSEYRVLHNVRQWDFGVAVDIRPDDRFLCSREEFADWAKGRKQLRMEYFYREMRKKYRLLMDDNEPVGGEWNYDKENRKPPEAGLCIPQPYRSKPNDLTLSVLALVEEHFADHFGSLEPFHFAVTRAQALSALDHFLKKRLCHFGDYQDAMLEGEPWMYHSHIAFYLNCGLLLPLECAEAAERCYREGEAPLNAVEGFIRQIIGWREYVRGIYWLKMPAYEAQNYLQAKHPLPDFYWTGNTRMNCMRQCVNETSDNAYAHHIQRLMVLGNFALLAGIHPDEVNEWFMIVYADAYQWVELPNVTGMALFADGGYLGSKPYAASGAYINRMSNYCKSCQYKVSKKNGPDACPFNYLYWDFMMRNKERLRTNHRLAMVYRTLQRMDKEKVIAVQQDSKNFFQALENNEEV